VQHATRRQLGQHSQINRCRQNSLSMTHFPFTTAASDPANRPPPSCADVSFFWEAPGRLGEFVPWAVTANMAAAGGTPARFRPGFPKTGGPAWRLCVLQRLNQRQMHLYQRLAGPGVRAVSAHVPAQLPVGRAAIDVCLLISLPVFSTSYCLKVEERMSTSASSWAPACGRCLVQQRSTHGGRKGGSGCAPASPAGQHS
jgi:hypothetical protein